MIQLFVVAAVVFVWIFFSKWSTAPDDAARRKLVQQMIMYGLLAFILLLAATGRIHWLGAVFAALVPVVKFILVWVLKLFPALANIYRNHGKPSAGGVNSSTDADPSPAEARKILGLPDKIDAEAVRAAHRRLIQKLHPDRDGSDYFAAKINQARDVLLRELGEN